MTEEINHLLHCARIETFELNEDKIVSNHISSDNANLLGDGINHRWHRPFFMYAGIFYVGIVCAGKFQLQIDMSASSLKRNLRSDGRNKSSLTLCANRNL